MEINNIIVSAIRDGNYTIDFDIVGENVNVYLSIDSGSEGSFQKIFENQSTGTLSYNGNIATGTHNAKLKLTNGVDTIESDFFKIIIKKIPTITSVEVDQVLDDGSFIISYTLKGHEDDTFTVKYLLDGEDTEYAVGDNIPIGTSTYSGSGLLLGTHMLKLVAVLESNEESYQLSIDNIGLEVKVLPKLENIIVEGSNNGSYVLGYKIVGDANHTYKVELQVNNDDYKTILENTTNGEKNHSGTDMPRGINTCRLKVSDDKDSYISNTFNIIIKNPLSIQNIIQTDSNSKGEYKLTFDILGDDLFLSTVELKIDNLNYKTIMKSQTAGKKLYNGNELSLGTHTAKLRIKDAVETFETEAFNINIVNKVPNLSMVLTSNESSNGTYTLYYATKDVETNVLTHKLKIDEGNYIEIAPTNNNNFFTYNGNGLEVGTHVGYIQVSDGLDNVISSQFNIIIPSIEHSIKESLANAKIQYDDKFNQLTDCVTNIIVDGLFDSNLENPLIEKALENYKYAYTEFNKIGQKANDSIGTNKITDAKGELEESISGVSGAITDLENTMYGVFADGILSDTEKDTIRKQLNLISKEKVDVDKDYELLYNNTDLIEENKAILKTAYDNFIEKHNTLIVTINNIVSKTSIVDETDRTNMNNAFEEWRNAIANYKEKSLNSIDAIAQKKADNSADIVDKKWADIILDPETGIQSTVGNLQQTITGLGGIEERLQKAEQTITKDSITSIVSESFYKKEEMDISLGVLSGKIENSVKSVDVMYYLSTSDTELIGGNWDTLAPTWEIGKYMWSKTVTTMIDNTTSETTPVCISSSLSKKFEISTNRQVIAYDSNNNLKDPTNIILTVDQQNFSDAITWSTNPTVELTGTGNTRTMYASNFANNDKIVVTVTSAGFTDSITLVKVRDGVNGQNGIDGKDGKDGTSVTILGSYNTKEELDAAHPTGNTNGDGYIVGSNLYVWIDTEFKDVGQIKGEDAITYYTWIKYANDSSGGGISDDPTGKEYIGFAYNKTTANESNNPNDYTWSLFKGTDGADGINGQNGKDGTTYYTWIKYSDSSDGSNMYDTPNNNTQYIGIAVNKISQTESTDKTQYSWSKFRGDNGVDGIDGTDGVDAYTIVLSNESHTFAGNETNALTSNTSINILAFKGETQVSTNIGKINNLPTGMSAIINNNNTINTSISISVTTSMTSRNGVVNIPITVNSKTFIKQFTYSLALKGQDGTNGKGIKSIVEYYKIHTSDSGITNESTGFTTNIPTMDDTNKYLWNYELITYTDNSTEKTTARVIGMYSKDGIDGTNGTDGKGITSITNYYLATPSDKGITTSTSGWTTTIQTIDANKKYLWNYEVINYTTGNPTTTTPCIIGSYGRDGTNGVGIKSITNYYLASFSSTNVTVNTSGWTTTIQIPDATNKYLWNYEKVIYTDNSEVNTNPCIIGNYAEDGTNGEDGKGIQSIVEYYAKSSSNTTAPTNFSTTVPTLDSTNRYLWNYEVINYTTGNPTTTAKKVIGVYGDKGEQGIPGNNGKDGKTTYFHVKYSAVENPTSAQMTETPSTYIGTYVDHIESDSTDPSKYTWSRFKGEQGIAGTNGEDGKTYYLHIKYSNDGTTFTSNNGETEGIYIGMYTDQNVNDSTNFNDYKWSKIQGTEIESITEEYYLSTSKTTQVDGEWVTTAPVWSVGKYMWTRSKIVYKYPSSVKYTTPICDTSWEAIDQLEIGGRNLWIDSNVWKNSECTIESLPSGNPTGQSKCYKLLNGAKLIYEIEPNYSSRLYRKVTVSAWIKYEDVVQGTDDWNKFNCFKNYLKRKNSSTGAESYTEYPAAYSLTGTSDWRKIVYTFDYSSNKDYDQLKTSLRFIMESCTSGTAWVTGIKVELGTKATDWTPAPEDTENLIDDAIYLLEQDLQGQIDGKIQTYYQTSDPSSTWTDTEIKTKHIGDIWYNGSYTYRWTGTTWDKLEDKDATNANVLASKKAQVFTTIPTVPYYKGDLWITNLTGTGVIKTCQTTRTSGNYTSSDWVEGLKYTDDTLAEENKKTITTVKQTSDKIYWLIESGDSSSSMTLTKDALDIIAENVRINGNVIVDGSITGDKMAAKTITADKVDLRNLNLVNDSGQTTLSISSSGNVAEMKIDNLKILANGSYESPMSSSQVQQTVDAFERKFVESGGYNKLRNSAFKNGMDGWNNLSWNNNGGMGGTSSFGIYEAGHEWALSNRNVLYAFGGDFDPTKYDGNQVLGVGVDSDIIWGGTQWTFSCLIACHRANSIVLEIIEYDSNNNRLPDMNTWIFYKPEVGSGGHNRDDYYKINKEFTLLNEGCAYFHIRLYLGAWEQNPIANAYLFLAEPQLVLGHKGDIPYTLNADEFYAGIIKEDASGIIVSMADGEGSQGYSKMSHDGFSIYNAQGTRKAWFGDSDSAYIQKLLTDDISCPTIVKYNTGRPTNFYIAQNATGDGTGRDANNKSNSINRTLRWIRDNYGHYSHHQDMNIYVEDGIYTENVMIAGWLGTGVINIIFGKYGTLYGTITVEGCMNHVNLQGGKTVFDGNEGWIIERRDGTNHGAAICILNSSVGIYGFRSRSAEYYHKIFINAENGSRVNMGWCDIVGYWAIARISGGCFLAMTDMRGDVQRFTEGASASHVILQGHMPYGGEMEHGTPWGALFSNLGCTSRNSVWIPRVEVTPPPPVVTWQWFEQTFTVSNLRSVPEGTGSTTSGIPGCMAQGYWSSYKAHRGYGDLGDSPASYCSGARNITITCTMHRKNSSHGNNSATPHPIFICPDGSSWDSGTYYARNESKTFTFPAAITNAIANGSMKTLQIWAGRSTAQYSHYDAVTITITCEKQV